MTTTINFKTACKEVTKLSIPLVGFRMIIYVNVFLSMLLVAKLGGLELAASAYITPIQTTVNVCGWSSIFSIPIVVGHMFGEGKRAELGKVLHQGWLIGIIVSVPMMLIFWYVGDILLFFGQDENLVRLVKPYFRVLTIGVLPGTFSICLTQFLIGMGKPKVAVFLSLISIVVTLSVGYVLLFGKFGFPNLGMVGMAYAYVISLCVNCITVYLYVWLNSFYKKFKLFDFSFSAWSKNFHYLRQILNLGLPMSVQFILELLAFSFTIIMVGWINQVSLAAVQIINQLNMIVIMGPFGISQAASVLVGQSLGAGQRSAAKSYSEAAIVLGLVFAAIVILLYTVFPKQLIGFYSIDIASPENFATVSIAITLFHINAAAQLFDGLRNILAGALRGFRDSVAPMWVSAMVIWMIGIPLGYFFGVKLNYGAPGISFSFLLAWIIGVLLLLKRFYRRVA